MSVTRFDPTEYFTPEELASVRERSDLNGALCILHAWAVIGLSMAMYAVWPNPLTFVLAVVIIGSRQLGLSILMHDGAHGVLMKTPWLNEFASQWFCAFPVIADTIPYRHYHLKHHRSTQQPDDPDLVLSKPFPITRESFRRKMVRDLTGRTGFKIRRFQFARAFGEKDQPLSVRFKALWERLGRQIIVNLVLLGILTALGKPHYYLMFWLLPLMTWQMAVTRIRNIAEHAMVPDNNDPFRNARTTQASLVARAFLAPYWVNYHVDHHLLMYVPCFNLPKLHRLLLAKGFGPKMEQRGGYIEVLKLATSKGLPPQALAA
ncbi:MAG TPA: fatty acid desaturase family protein [Rhizomicrobium sp.]|jgi:fatty acid desaturase|nr:fatty acid desaturase family protein [Rhizomicrobium sp.]